MAPSDEDKRTTDRAEQGVLGSLPSTRPQRPSERRAAARDAAAKRPTGTKSAGTKRAAEPKRTTEAKRTTGTKRGVASDASPPSSAPRKASPGEPRIPRQGFETEEEIAPGSTVHPPSRPELAAAVADLLGELAQGGVTAGGRLLKDFLGRLPGV